MDKKQNTTGNKNAGWGNIGRLASVGLEFVLCIMIGMGLGLWTDSIFHCEPWGFFSGLGAGIISAFRVLIHVAARSNRKI